MKKKIFAVAIALLSLGSFAAMAQAENSNKEGLGCPKSEQCAPENCNPESCNPGEKCGKSKPCKEGKKFKEGKQCKNGKKCKAGKRKEGKFKGEARRHEKCEKKNRGEFLANLNLTPGQQVEFNKIMSEKRDAIANAKEKAGKERKKLNEKFDKKIEKVLSPEQFAQYQKNRLEMRKDRPSKFARKTKDFKKGNRGGLGKPQRGPEPAMLTNS
ncbi:MAG: hypothetical protein K2N03_06820 [Muribaculaceae bacterium]|nr:hypothetical protein [Muribaculaceae bacterium]